MTSPFFTLPTLRILQSAFKQEEELVDLTTILSEQPPSTPPLILREDLYDVQVISQEEFLAAADRRFQREFDEYCLQTRNDPWENIH